jgi:ribosomal protein S6E (S10)
MDRLRTKVYWAEYDKEHPFEVLMSKSAEQMKVRVSDLLTGEWRSFTIQTSDLEKLSDNQIKSERKGFVPKPSIDEYIRKLQDGISST